MEIKDIYKLLKIESLDESQQEVIKEKLDDIIDVKARERADVILEGEKKTLVEEYEQKFEDYKKDITSKFSNFVDSVLDEELKIPEKVMQYAKLGEEYHSLIEQFKVKLAVDEGILSDEVKSLLKEAKDEILKTKEELNKTLADKMELEDDAKEMAAHIYLRKKCDGLTEAQRTKVLSLLNDIKSASEIDKKFKVIVEDFGSGMGEPVKPGTEEPDAEAKTNANICPKCGAVATPKGDETIVNCPHCGAKMKDAADLEKAETMGQGQTQLTDPPEVSGKAEVPAETKVEGTDFFEQNKAAWLKVLKENKI